MQRFHTSVANWYTSNLKTKGLEFVFVSQTGVWLRLRRIRGLLWFRMRGGARFPWLSPFEQVRPGFLFLDVKDVTCALNEHSIIDVAEASTG